MQTVKVRRSIPIWVIALLFIVAVVAIVFALGLSGLFGDFLGTTSLGLTNIAIIIFTEPYLWASTNIINGITFTIAGILIVGTIFLLIAKRRYLVSQKMIMPTGGAAYQPQSQLSTPKLYSGTAPSPASTPAPAPVVPEEKKAE